MLMDDLITLVQENVPVKIVVFNNGSLGFVELEQKVAGLLDAYTGLQNPNFAKVAEAIGIAGWRVEHPPELGAAVTAWLAAPGPALLDVVVERDELVMPPHIAASQVLGTALYAAKALMAGADYRKDAISLVKDACCHERCWRSCRRSLFSPLLALLRARREPTKLIAEIVAMLAIMVVLMDRGMLPLPMWKR